MDNDEVIYSRFLKERNEEDLRILLIRHKDPLLFFLYGYVHNMKDAEELMIDSFAEVAAGRQRQESQDHCSDCKWKESDI